MRLDSYQTSSNQNTQLFTFLSVGHKGIVVKIVNYEQIEENKFNLSFGDYDIVSQTINDTIVTNNGDGGKVLATVVRTLFPFFEKYPNAQVFVEGSNQARTKLYQRIIRDYSKFYEHNFVVMGIVNYNHTFEKIDFLKKYVQFRINKK